MESVRTSLEARGAESGVLRRRSDRRQIHATVDIVAPIETHGVVTNASDNGMCVLVFRMLLEGEEIVVESESLRPRRWIARVVWVRQAGEGWAAGLELVWPR